MQGVLVFVLIAVVAVGAYQLGESEDEVVYRVTRGAKGGRNRGECRYRKGPWEECNPTTNTQERTLSLKKGEANCEKSKIIRRKCKKVCRYENGEWSECDPVAKTRSRTDALKEGSDPGCEAERTVTKKCKKACRYERRAEWSPCDQVTGQKTKVVRLLGGQPAECEPTKTVTKQCQGKKGQSGDDYDDEE